MAVPPNAKKTILQSMLHCGPRNLRHSSRRGRNWPKNQRHSSRCTTPPSGTCAREAKNAISGLKFAILRLPRAVFAKSSFPSAFFAINSLPTAFFAKNSLPAASSRRMHFPPLSSRRLRPNHRFLHEECSLIVSSRCLGQQDFVCRSAPLPTFLRRDIH